MSKYLEESYNEALRENLALIEQNKKLQSKIEKKEVLLNYTLHCINSGKINDESIQKEIGRDIMALLGIDIFKK